MSITAHESRDSRVWIFGCLGLVLIKLWLLSPQEIIARTAPHDDTLFVGLALSILEGEWLGAYNQFTLMKGSGYPLFIALSNVLGLPLILSQELLYLGACFLFTFGIRLLGASTTLSCLAFALLAFNPFTYNFFPNVYPFRFGIYPAVSLMLFAVGQIILIRASQSRRHWGIALAFGLLLGWFWNIRGEAIWIAPTLGVFLLSYWYVTARSERISTSRRVFTSVVGTAALVWIGLFGVNTAIATKNYQVYGVYTTNEMTSPAFKSAYGGLLRISTARWQRFIPVSQEARSAAYSVSPAFRQLEYYFEEGRGLKTWKKGFSDYPAAFFPWAFRDGLFSIGLFRDAKKTHMFLERIGREIDSGCDSRQIDCRPRYTNLAPAWHSEWNSLAVDIFFQTMSRIVKFKGFVGNGPRDGSVDDDKLVTNYKYVTQSPVRPQSVQLLQRVPEFHRQRIHDRRIVFHKILWIYRHIPQIAFVVGLAILLRRAFQIARGTVISVSDGISVALLAGITSYAAILAIVQVTSYSEIGRQLNTTYPLVLAFIISCAMSLIASRRNRREQDQRASADSA